LLNPDYLSSSKAASAGTKGPRLHDWCYRDLADLDVEEFNSAHQGLWTRGLLIRRHIADGNLAFFTTWCPAATSIETLVAIEGPSVGDRGQFWDREKRVRARSQREQVLAWVVSPRFPGDARLRHDGGDPHRANQPPQKKETPKNHSKNESRSLAPASFA
jgi:hypothetical protein